MVHQAPSVSIVRNAGDHGENRLHRKNRDTTPTKSGISFVGTIQVQRLASFSWLGSTRGDLKESGPPPHQMFQSTEYGVGKAH